MLLLTSEGNQCNTLATLTIVVKLQLNKKLHVGHVITHDCANICLNLNILQ
jgi:hypothetical protein